MARRKTQYERDSEELLRRGYDPTRLTIRQRHEILHGKVEGTPIPTLLGVKVAK